MRKFLFFTTLVSIIFLFFAVFTPVGMWVLFAITETGNINILVVVIATLVVALIATIPRKKEILKVQRKWICCTVVVVATIIVLSTMNLGGSIYGEWLLVQDARVDSFRIANLSNIRLRFENDDMLLFIFTDNNIVEESTWRIVENGTRNIVIIGGTAYEYRFSRFGYRLILEETGANRPRIPHMTPQRDLEVTFRRFRR